MSDTNVTARLTFQLPFEFSGVGNAVILPNDTQKWKDDMLNSRHFDDSEPGVVTLVMEIVNDGGGVIALTLCPYDEKDSAGDNKIGNNLSISLSNKNARMIGKALVAIALLNPPV